MAKENRAVIFKGSLQRKMVGFQDGDRYNYREKFLMVLEKFEFLQFALFSKQLRDWKNILEKKLRTVKAETSRFKNKIKWTLVVSAIFHRF